MIRPHRSLGTGLPAADDLIRRLSTSVAPVIRTVFVAFMSSISAAIDWMLHNESTADVSNSSSRESSAFQIPASGDTPHGNLEALVEEPRARGAFVLRLELDGDWAIEVADESMLTVMAVLAGDCVVTTASGEATAQQGNVVVVRGPGPFSVASEPGRPPDFIIPPDQTCVDVHGNRLVESMSRGIRTWGTTVRGEDRILVGTYANPLEVGRLSAQLLPELMVERTDATTQAFAELLADQAATDAPGQAVVLDRLLDVLLVAAVRAAEDKPARRADPPIDRILDRLHKNPQSPLSVEAMARMEAMSRAAFSQRFSQRTGMGPGAYLRRLRLAWAADALLAGTRTVAAIAEQAGYGSPASFSTAFKQEYGQSPHDWQLQRGGKT